MERLKYLARTKYTPMYHLTVFTHGNMVMSEFVNLHNDWICIKNNNLNKSSIMSNFDCKLNCFDLRFIIENSITILCYILFSSMRQHYLQFFSFHYQFFRIIDIL